MTLAVSVLAIQVASYVSAMNIEGTYDTKLLLNSASYKQTYLDKHMHLYTGSGDLVLS